MVIQTLPHREGDVNLLLSRAGFETCYPKIRERSYRYQSSFFKGAPLFPSYFFLNIDFNEKNYFHLVKYTRGVNKILCNNGIPIAIDQNIIDTIKSRANIDGFIEGQTFLKPGDTIRVKKGILKELVGILEKPVSQEGRVQVLLNLVNYQMRAKLHWSEMEKLKIA